MTTRGITHRTLSSLDAPLPADTHGIVVHAHGAPVGVAVRRATEPDHRFLARARASALEGAMTQLLEEVWAPSTRAPAPSITIVICTHERPALLARLLRSLAALRDAAPPGPVVLVVDNAPRTPGTQQVVGEFAWATYLVEPVAGLNIARNAGWRAARSEWIAYLDDDVEVALSWLAGLTQALDHWPALGAVTGLVLPWGLETEAQRIFERRGGFGRGVLPGYERGRTRESDSLFPVGAGQFGAGCNMVIRRSILEAIGGFDDALDTGAPLPGGGDLDIFFRVLDHGAALAYAPAMAVYHEHRRYLDGLSRQYHSWGLGFFAYLEAIVRRDPRRRAAVGAMRRWWVVDWGFSLLRALAGRGPLEPALVMAEGRGALEGWLGEYDRSRDRIRAQRMDRP